MVLRCKGTSRTKWWQVQSKSLRRTHDTGQTGRLAHTRIRNAATASYLQSQAGTTKGYISFVTVHQTRTMHTLGIIHNYSYQHMLMGPARYRSSLSQHSPSLCLSQSELFSAPTLSLLRNILHHAEKAAQLTGQ